VGEEGKKESEPFAVPTAGAFYMHDDRFQEARGRGRGRLMALPSQINCSIPVYSYLRD
jgi:hypothetical protein